MFKFYASDRVEPVHVHVLGNGGEAKIWVVPKTELSYTRGYDESQVNRIMKITEEHREGWISVWRRFFSER